MTFAALRHFMECRREAKGYGSAYPSIRTIAKITRMSGRMVERHISDLQDLGVIRCRLRPGRTTLIEFTDVLPTPDTGVTPQPPTSMTGGDDIHDGGPPTSMTPTPDTGVTRSKEPLKNTTEEHTPKNESTRTLHSTVIQNSEPSRFAEVDWDAVAAVDIEAAHDKRKRNEQLTTEEVHALEAERRQQEIARTKQAREQRHRGAQ